MASNRSVHQLVLDDSFEGILATKELVYTAVASNSGPFRTTASANCVAPQMGSAF